MQYLDIGTISSGTLRTRDLLDAFADKLDACIRANPETRDDSERSAIADAREAIAILDRYESRGDDPQEALAEMPEISDCVERLQEFLQGYAPPFCYVGTLEGDGAEFGCWPDIEMLERDIEDDECARVSDPAELDNVPHDTAAVVNDHGNVTLYAKHSDGWRIVWAAV